jgi:proliferating cell nuclear antigen
MPTIEASEEDLSAPKISYQVKAKIVTPSLNQTIEDAQLVSDHVQINATQDAIVLNATGDLMSADITLLKGSDALLDIEAKEPCKATYSLSYLSEIVKAASAISDLAVVEFATDMPVHLDFVLQEGKAEFWLAPRIDAGAA